MLEVDESGISRKDTFTKSERKRITEKLGGGKEGLNGSVNASRHRPKLVHDVEITRYNKEKMTTTSFKEVADKKKRNEVNPILPASNSNSPLSWYIPSDPPSRSNSKNSDNSPNQFSRQNSNEYEYSSPPPATTCRSSQANLRTRASSVSTYHPSSGNSNRYSHVKSRHFGQMYPSRQASQDSEIPQNQCRGIQTGSSLLRMYLKKVLYPS